MILRRIVMIVVLFVAILGAAWFALRDRLDPGRQLPPPVAALQAHLRSQGLDTTGRLAPRGGLSRVRQLIHFSVAGSEQPFFVMWCESAADAQAQLERLRLAPRNSLPQANAEFVIYLTEWPADAPLTRQVIGAFASFRGGTAAVR
jgi:hypothetical protein